MGAWFSNLHIKKESTSESDIKRWILAYFLEKGFVQADSNTADFEVNILASESSHWISVYCDAFTHTDILSLSPRISQNSGNDVLGIACFDSDYLFLNLLNVNENRDLWLNIGDSPELKKPRRSKVLSWKNSVKNIDAFRSAAKKDYVCAEDFLLSVQDELDLSFEQSTGFDLPDSASKMYFSTPQKDSSLLTKLEIKFFDLMPCVPGKRETCLVNNRGASSRGLAVLFVGNYVENDEITIDNASFCFWDHWGNQVDVPITFTKRQLSDGQWVYYWEDKNFKIPQVVSQNLPPKVRDDKESLNSFGIRYTPNGNKRKFLDITVVFAPLSNWSGGQCFWRVWAHSSSKQKFIETHNQGWKKCSPNLEEVLLNPDEYDLD